jgi:hypothetical protein
MNIEIVQQRDIYTWQVRYEDDTFLPEYSDEQAEGRGFAEVEQARVRFVYLLGQEKAYIVRIPEGATPVFFRRRSIQLFLAEGAIEGRGTVHCIGWKREESGVYLFVAEDGSTLLTDDLQAV